MKWEELDNDINTFEKDCLTLLRDIETKELTSQGLFMHFQPKFGKYKQQYYL